MKRLTLALSMPWASALSQTAMPAQPRSARAIDMSATVRYDTLFRQWSSDSTPGCAVGVMRNGAFVYGRGFGMSDIASRSRMATSTILGAGSLSKQFTAFALAKLAEAGRLSPEDDVRRYIGELPNYGATIRVRDLLNHTSGIRDYLSMIALSGRDPEGRVSRVAALNLIVRQRALNHSPGSTYSYSNSNYFLLALIVERVTAMPFAHYMRDSVFLPQGMRHTRFALDGDVSVGQAESYRRTDDGRLEQVAIAGMLSGEGGAYTTIDDMLRWEQMLRRSGALVNRFREPGRFPDGRAIGYGWGTEFNSYRTVSTEGHGGTWGGFRAYYLRFPSLGVATVALCNQLEISPFQLTRRLADAAMGSELAPRAEPIPPPVTPTNGARVTTPSVARSEVEALLGRFVSEELDATFELTHANGRLQLRAEWSDPIVLSVAHRDTLVAQNRQLIVHRNDTGRATSLILNSGRVKGVRFNRR